MSKQSLGKTLLRNVIRHTGASNKIQEELEMWKMRDWEVKMSHHKHLPATENMRGHMHCNRGADGSSGQSRGREPRVHDHDDREARYWTRKLYEFEDNDPDRWGHSGFKELYPEEFESDSEKNSSTKKIGEHRTKKSKSGKTVLLKSPKKSSRKKKKKRKKKEEGGKRKKANCSISDGSGDDSSATKDKRRRKRTKSRQKNKKAPKTRGRDEDSSSADSGDRASGRRTHSRKRRKPDSDKDSDSGSDSKKKRRKNWKAAGEESSDDSSGD